MPSIPTIKIINPKKTNSFLNINKSDFDESIHVKWVDRHKKIMDEEDADGKEIKKLIADAAVNFGVDLSKQIGNKISTVRGAYRKAELAYQDKLEQEKEAEEKAAVKEEVKKTK